MPIPPIDIHRPECKRIADQIKELQREKRTWADRLRTTTDPEERDNIIHTIEGIENHIQFYDEQLMEEGCYLPPPVVVTRLLEIVHIEQTQSTQYYSAAGTGAGPDNSVWAIQSKPMLVRVYVRCTAQSGNTVSGSLEVMGYNSTSLKYDIFNTGATGSFDWALNVPSASHRAGLIGETLRAAVAASSASLYCTVRFFASRAGRWKASAAFVAAYGEIGLKIGSSSANGTFSLTP